MSFAKECFDAGNGVKLNIECDSREVLEGVREDGEHVGDAVSWGEGRLSKVQVTELNSVRKRGGLGGLVRHMKSAVVVEGRSDVEAIAGAEVAKRDGIEAVGAIEVCPSGDSRA